MNVETCNNLFLHEEACAGGHSRGIRRVTHVDALRRPPTTPTWHAHNAMLGSSSSATYTLQELVSARRIGTRGHARLVSIRGLACARRSVGRVLVHWTVVEWAVRKSAEKRYRVGAARAIARALELAGFGDEEYWRPHTRREGSLLGTKSGLESDATRARK